MLNDAKCNIPYMDPMRMIFPGHDNATDDEVYMVCVAITLFFRSICQSSKICAKKDQEENIYLLSAHQNGQKLRRQGSLSTPQTGCFVFMSVDLPTLTRPWICFAGRIWRSQKNGG